MTQTERILEALRKGPLTNADIVRAMNIFNSTGRISDLRKQGYRIEARKVRGGLWEYKLMPDQGELFEGRK